MFPGAVLCCGCLVLKAEALVNQSRDVTGVEISRSRGLREIILDSIDTEILPSLSITSLIILCQVLDVEQIPPFSILFLIRLEAELVS